MHHRLLSRPVCVALCSLVLTAVFVVLWLQSYRAGVEPELPGDLAKLLRKLSRKDILANHWKACEGAWFATYVPPIDRPSRDSSLTKSGWDYFIMVDKNTVFMIRAITGSWRMSIIEKVEERPDWNDWTRISQTPTNLKCPSINVLGFGSDVYTYWSRPHVGGQESWDTARSAIGEKQWRIDTGVYRVWSIYLPLVFIVSICSIYPAIILGFRPLRRVYRRCNGMCTKCGYNLRGTANLRCSECGSLRPSKTT